MVPLLMSIPCLIAFVGVLPGYTAAAPPTISEISLVIAA
ncbi:Uncharacterised protein [Bordetella pertussis]|nr:Uncharacterised protein [Bordetella pertussis]